MRKIYDEYKKLDLPAIANKVSKYWQNNDIASKSIDLKEDKSKKFIFYEGPPSANGKPGIHHVISRTIKDIFCRYKSIKGYIVRRKAGWDSHGLPVELEVEKKLNITKEDIGKKISIKEFNSMCKKEVMKYTENWNELTDKIGFWLDTKNPYITYKTKYIESVWWILSQLYKKDLLYKHFTIQPYSPKAGTGLSSHELNMPGCYKQVLDLSIVAKFKLDTNIDLFTEEKDDIYLLAWTTTPWTLPSNAALSVGSYINYVMVKTFDQYVGKVINVILGKDTLSNIMGDKYIEVKKESQLIFKQKSKVPYFVVKDFKGSQLVGLKYQPLFTYVKPHKNIDNAFKVFSGDFVNTEEGTGIVHIAPTFGSDDYALANKNDIPFILAKDDNGNRVPLVDLQGRFVDQVTDFKGMYVKNEYYDEDKKPSKSVDVLIAIKLKEEGKVFDTKKYKHSYPHCWRTDKPVLYYPINSWLIRTSKLKRELVELNKNINWNPQSTGKGRFENWLMNINDWNLSRSRFWGIPLPIWVEEYGDEKIIINSIKQLKMEIAKSIKKGFMTKDPFEKFDIDKTNDENYDSIDIHKPFIDEVILVSSKGNRMIRELDLIDVWFDSGSMPYAQWHYPFENKDFIEKEGFYPADFIAEGVDQTRGWFFTLHVISVMLFGKNSFKNVISNGLVLDKYGHKMSKRLGNTIDPFTLIDKYGPDALRWYMISNNSPWENLKFDENGILEVINKVFNTIHNTYSFFAMYANIDNFSYKENDITHKDRPEMDRWILSELNTLIYSVEKYLEDYSPTKAIRIINNFVIDDISNWYVRLNRRRFWKSDYTQDKISAYQTLYICLLKLTQISSPFAPFFMDFMYMNLAKVKSYYHQSVHIQGWPDINCEFIDNDLQNKFRLSKKITSIALSLRKKLKIKVRQPLQRMLICLSNNQFKDSIQSILELVKREVNVKQIEFIEKDSDILVKKITPVYSKLGPKYKQYISKISQILTNFTNDQIQQIQDNEVIVIKVDGKDIPINLDEVVISTKDIKGWSVSKDNDVTIALDTNIDDTLKSEGITRDVINRIQKHRKQIGMDVVDKIIVSIFADRYILENLKNNEQFLKNETLAVDINFDSKFLENYKYDNLIAFELEGCKLEILISKFK